MIPVVIEDLINNVTNKSRSLESRQFYYMSLLEIQKQVNAAILKYNYEKDHGGK
jgi:hypothetical protein